MPRSTSSRSAAAWPVWRPLCLPAGMATRSSCWRRHRSSAEPRRKAAFWYWVPNNAAMRAAGAKDPKADCIRYMARLSRPEVYNPNAPRFGMPAWEYSQYEAIYDNASTATELLSKKGALEYRHCDFVPDYWAELPEDKAPKGRVLLPKGGTGNDVGRRRSRGPHHVGSRQARWSRYPHRPSRSASDQEREPAKSSASRPIRRKARSAFSRARRWCSALAASPTTSNFARTTSDCAGLRRLRGATATRAISSTSPATVGAQLRNMNYAWMCPIVFEKAIAQRSRLDRHVFAVRRLDDLRQQRGPPRRQRKAGL